MDIGSELIKIFKKFFNVGICAQIASHQKCELPRGQLVPFCCKTSYRNTYINYQNKI